MEISKDENNLEYVYEGKNEFIDQRGKISNYELTEPINLIGYIESKKYNKSKSLPSNSRAKMLISKRAIYQRL